MYRKNSTVLPSNKKPMVLLKEAYSKCSINSWQMNDWANEYTSGLNKVNCASLQDLNFCRQICLVTLQEGHRVGSYFSKLMDIRILRLWNISRTNVSPDTNWKTKISYRYPFNCVLESTKIPKYWTLSTFFGKRGLLICTVRKHWNT